MLEGVSLKPLLNDPDKSLKKGAFTQFERPIKFKDHPMNMGYSVRTERYRYTEYIRIFEERGIKWLLNFMIIRKDPARTINQADRKEYASDIKQLSDMLKKKPEEKSVVINVAKT